MYSSLVVSVSCDLLYVPAVCFLQKDLVHTIGESAALGAAGFVIWGDLNLTSSRVGDLCLWSLISAEKENETKMEVFLVHDSGDTLSHRLF